MFSLKGLQSVMCFCTQSVSYSIVSFSFYLFNVFFSTIAVATINGVILVIVFLAKTVYLCVFESMVGVKPYPWLPSQHRAAAPFGLFPYWKVVLYLFTKQYKLVPEQAGS